MRFGVYVDADGSGLHGVADLRLRRLREIARDYPLVRVIDDRFEKTPDMHPDDLPDWNLGLNFNLERDTAALAGGNLPRIRTLSQESGRDFAVGYDDRVLQINEGIGFIEADTECDDFVRILESLAKNG